MNQHQLKQFEKRLDALEPYYKPDKIMGVLADFIVSIVPSVQSSPDAETTVCLKEAQRTPEYKRLKKLLTKTYRGRMAANAY